MGGPELWLDSPEDAGQVGLKLQGGGQRAGQQTTPPPNYAFPSFFGEPISAGLTPTPTTWAEKVGGEGRASAVGILRGRGWSMHRRRGGHLSRRLRLPAQISNEFPVTGAKSRVEEGALRACEAVGRNQEAGCLAFFPGKARGTKDTQNCLQMCVCVCV